MSSTFDKDTFMNSTTTDANDTRFVPVPVGEYPARVEAVEPRLAGEKPVLEIKWAITDEAACKATGMAVCTVRQTIWLDITAQGGLDNGKGKNVGLGKLRAALGQNEAGRPWGPGMMVGQVALIKVSHRAGKDDEIFADVKAVTAL